MCQLQVSWRHSDTFSYLSHEHPKSEIEINCCAPFKRLSKRLAAFADMSIDRNARIAQVVLYACHDSYLAENA